MHIFRYRVVIRVGDMAKTGPLVPPYLIKYLFMTSIVISFVVVIIIIC